ncbi:integrator complex subunit 9-like [Tropilaelaps mercedesae]|uniref:Integrator complex subunit 9-like n=1 Tax=Tropilaelaps mercedesae TaxID=418985 RepID=A0A1V9X678_9ACAR|nr:integrator complex subunit 9-like [Tropilaelaps mercedesae]
MRLYCLSDNPNEPCYVLKHKNSLIMLDCALDLSSVMSFVPLTMVHSPRLSQLAAWTARDGALENHVDFRENNGRAFINAEPEFLLPELGLLNIGDIDVILISNYTNMLALPFITENPAFRGEVYMTEPTSLIGRLYMDELIEYIERCPKPKVATKIYKEMSFFKHLGAFHTDAEKVPSWREIYTTKNVASCLTKVKTVGFNEKLSVFGNVQVSCVSAGFCVGSCNWIIQSDQERVGYMASSSTLTTHPKPIEHQPLRNMDVLIMTSLTQTPLAIPDTMLSEMCQAVEQTLKNGGNVLIPCHSAGVVYDLFECLSGHLESRGQLNTMYFVSPVANKSLAYSSILAEWLTSSKQQRVYIPEEPFPHSHLMKSGRLKVYESIADQTFMNEFHVPCVVFAGHPSLRFGDSVHLMELWHSDPNNAVIFTEPDFNYVDAVAPFQPISIKVLYYPIDTSLSFAQANKLLRDLRPNILLSHKQYSEPPAMCPARAELALEPEFRYLTFRRPEVVQIPIKRKIQRVKLDPALADEIVPVELESRKGVAVSSLTATLSVNNNQCTLKKPPDLSTKITHPYGELNVKTLTNRLTKAGFTDIKTETTGSATTIHLAKDGVLIRLEDHSTHILDSVDTAVRSKVQNAVLESLEKF